MTDEQIERFVYLFRKYRDDEELPPDERNEFRKLAVLWRKLRNRDLPGRMSNV